MNYETGEHFLLIQNQLFHHPDHFPNSSVVRPFYVIPVPRARPAGLQQFSFWCNPGGKLNYFILNHFLIGHQQSFCYDICSVLFSSCSYWFIALFDIFVCE